MVGGEESWEHWVVVKQERWTIAGRAAPGEGGEPFVARLLNVRCMVDSWPWLWMARQAGLVLTILCLFAVSGLVVFTCSVLFTCSGGASSCSLGCWKRRRIRICCMSENLFRFLSARTVDSFSLGEARRS